MSPRRRYTAAYRAKAVQAYREAQPASYRAVAKQVGVYHETLRMWVQAANGSGTPSPVPTDSAYEAELRSLRSENAGLRADKAALLAALRVCLAEGTPV